MHTKKVFICILILLTLLFVSCGNSDYIDPNKEAIKTGEDIIKCIKSQNANEIMDIQGVALKTTSLVSTFARTRVSTAHIAYGASRALCA